MKTPRGQCDENATAVSGLERILRNYRWAAASLRATREVAYAPIVPKWLMPRYKMCVPHPSRAEEEDTYEAMVDGLVSEELEHSSASLHFIDKIGEYDRRTDR